MNELLDKISSYNIFNYLLPGILFVIIIDKTTHYSLIQDNLIIGAFIYYFTGLVISRFGSLVIEPLLKKIKFVKHEEYHNFVIASQQDHKIEIFSETNNMYRTFASMFVLILLLKLYEMTTPKIHLSNEWNIYILIILLLVMFFWSYKKQTNYIKKRIKANLTKNSNT